MRGKRMTRRLLVLPIALFAGVFAATWIFLDAREAARPLPGDVVFLRLAAGGGASWIQLYNRTDHRIDLTGAVVSDGQHISTLEGDLTIDAHDTLLASRTATAGAPGPARTRAFWRGFSISKNGGEIVLLMNRERDTMLDFLQTVPMDAEQYLARV
ncbi:MAG TPA: lamin tail domain-containing protein, partial [Longimicrobium sp.]|nr:lamin tail domain-containing protein [Longimicrobium sp.]